MATEFSITGGTKLVEVKPAPPDATMEGVRPDIEETEVVMISVDPLASGKKGIQTHRGNVFVRFELANVSPTKKGTFISLRMNRNTAIRFAKGILLNASEKVE